MLGPTAQHQGSEPRTLRTGELHAISPTAPLATLISASMRQAGLLGGRHIHPSCGDEAFVRSASVLLWTCRLGSIPMHRFLEEHSKA